MRNKIQEQMQKGVAVVTVHRAQVARDWATTRFE